VIAPTGCVAPFHGPEGDAATDALSRYAVSNNFVILSPCIGLPVDLFRFKHAHEMLRGLADVYGQLSDDYTTQTGFQMKPLGKMVRRLLGMNEDGKEEFIQNEDVFV